MTVKLPSLTPYLTLAGAACAILAAGWWIYSMRLPSVVPIKQWMPATPATQTILIPKVTIQPPRVEVYAPAAKTRLKLPEPIVADPAAHVIAATRIEAGDHPSSIVTLIDERTGATETLVRREPLPWLAARQTGEIRLDYGYRNAPSFAKEGWGGFGGIARLSLREDLLQVKALRLGAPAAIYSDGQMFAGAGVGWLW